MSILAATPLNRRPVNTLAVLTLLITLTALAATGAWVDSAALRISIISLIAFAKVLLVMIYFMQLRFEARLFYYIALLPLLLSAVLLAGMLPDIAANPPAQMIEMNP